MTMTEKAFLVAVLCAPAIVYAQSRIQVSEPVTVELSTHSGDIEVSTTDGKQVVVDVGGSDDGVTVTKTGNRVTVALTWKLQKQRVKLAIPKNSSVRLQTISGDVRIATLDGRAKVRTVSGDVELDSPAASNVETVSGDIRVQRARGPVELQTVSGDADVRGASASLEMESVSGDLAWHGTCGKTCRIQAETHSGTVTLHPTAQSSFDVHFDSMNGRIQDAKKMLNAQNRFGSGEGRVDVETFSGRLRLE